MDLLQAQQLYGTPSPPRPRASHGGRRSHRELSVAVSSPGCGSPKLPLLHSTPRSAKKDSNTAHLGNILGPLSARTTRSELSEITALYDEVAERIEMSKETQEDGELRPHPPDEWSEIQSQARAVLYPDAESPRSQEQKAYRDAVLAAANQRPLLIKCNEKKAKILNPGLHLYESPSPRKQLDASERSIRERVLMHQRAAATPLDSSTSSSSTKQALALTSRKSRRIVKKKTVLGPSGQPVSHIINYGKSINGQPLRFLVEQDPPFPISEGDLNRSPNVFLKLVQNEFVISRKDFKIAKRGIIQVPDDLVMPGCSSEAKVTLADLEPIGEPQERNKKGTVSRMYRSTEDPNLKYWVKSFTLTNPRARAQLIREVNAYTRLQTRHFATLNNAVLDLLTLKVHMFVHHCKFGSMEDILKSRGPLCEPVLSVFMRQLLNSLLWLHEVHNFVSNNIDLKNIMCIKDHPYVCLTGWESAMLSNDRSPDSIQESWGGNWNCLSPERLLKIHCVCKSDVYSVGLIALQLITGKHPYEHPSRNRPETLVDFKKRILEQGKPAIPPSVSDELRVFLDRCLVKFCSQRSSVKDLLELPFIVQYRHVGGEYLGRWFGKREFEARLLDRASSVKSSTEVRSSTVIQLVRQHVLESGMPVQQQCERVRDILLTTCKDQKTLMHAWFQHYCSETARDYINHRGLKCLICDLQLAQEKDIVLMEWDPFASRQPQSPVRSEGGFRASPEFFVPSNLPNLSFREFSSWFSANNLFQLLGLDALS